MTYMIVFGLGVAFGGLYVHWAMRKLIRQLESDRRHDSSALAERLLSIIGNCGQTRMWERLNRILYGGDCHRAESIPTQVFERVSSEILTVLETGDFDEPYVAGPNARPAAGN